MKTLVCCLNSKYVHASLAPWCLLAGVKEFCTTVVTAEVFESTINANTEDIARQIIEKGPQTVSFSCYIWNISKTIEVCRLIKESLDVSIILGGPEVAFRPDDVLEKYDFVDFVLSGEGEETFPLLLDVLTNGGDLNAVSGLSFRNQKGIVSVPVKINQSTPPSPYTDEFFNALKGRISYFESSRGCPYRCAFCLSGRCGDLRFFDIDQVKSDLLKLANSGTKTIKFVDRTFNANYKRANEILNFIMENIGVNIPKDVCFHFEIAGDILNDSTMSILSQMPKGTVQLEIGMQSFNEETLRLINRKTNTTRLISNIKKLIEMGNMHIHIDLIAGLTGEDFASFKRSFNIAYNLKAHMLQMGFLKLLYGADMREEKEKYPCEFSCEPPYEVLSTPWLKNEEILELKRTEDAVDRLYNSGRFLGTLNYLINNNNIQPFDVFYKFGNSYNGEGVSLKDYSWQLFLCFKDVCDEKMLREKIVEDMLLCGCETHIPIQFKVSDPLYKAVKTVVGANKKVALLYSTQKVLVVDENGEKDFFGRKKGNYINFKEFM